MDKQRQTLKTDGKMLVVGEAPVDAQQLGNLFARYGKPADITWKTAAEVDELKDAAYDDSSISARTPTRSRGSFPKLAVRGLFNIVQCGGKFGRPVISQVGRVHYGGIRIIGTTGSDPAEAMATSPPRRRSAPTTRSTSSAPPARWAPCTSSATSARACPA